MVLQESLLRAEEVVEATSNLKLHNESATGSSGSVRQRLKLRPPLCWGAPK